MVWLEAFSRLAKAHQTQQTKLPQLLHPEAPVVVVAEGLVFHAAQAPTNPRVQVPETRPTCEPPSGEVLSCTADDLVEFHNNFCVQVVRAAGQFPNLIAKFPH